MDIREIVAELLDAVAKLSERVERLEDDPGFAQGGAVDVEWKVGDQVLRDGVAGKVIGSAVFDGLVTVNLGGEVIQCSPCDLISAGVASERPDD